MVHIIENKWDFYDNSGHVFSGKILKTSYYCCYFILLRVKTTNIVKNILIPVDAVTNKEFKYLRVNALY